MTYSIFCPRQIFEEIDCLVLKNLSKENYSDQIVANDLLVIFARLITMITSKNDE